MKLIKKIVLLLMIIFVLYGAVDYGIQRFIIFPSFISLEQDEAEKDMERSMHAVRNEINQIDSLCHDWSAWDDTYDFVENPSEDYIKSNLVLSSFTNNKLNLIYLCDTAGTVVWGKIVDLETEQEIHIPDFPIDAFPSAHPLITYKTGDTPLSEIRVTGVVNTKKGPMMVSSRPIINSTKVKPIRGNLIMGRFLSNELTKTLSEQIKVDFRVIPATPENLTGILKDISGQLSPKTPYFFKDQSADLMTVYSAFPDIKGNRTFLLSAAVPKRITGRGRSIINYALFSNLTAGFVIVCIMLFLIRATIIRQISSLISFANESEGADDIPVSDLFKSTDEIKAPSRNLSNLLEQLEDIIRLRKGRYRLLAENLSDAVWILDLENLKLTYISPSIERILNYTPEEMKHLKLNEYVTPESFEYAMKMLEEKLDNELEADSFTSIPHILKMEQYRKDGSCIWTEITLNFLSNEEGNPIAVLGTTRDISERIQAERELKESEEKFRKIFENANDAIIYMDKEGRIIEGNTKLWEIFGYTPSEITGKLFAELDIFGPKDTEIAREALDNILNGKPVPMLELIASRKDGISIYIDINAKAIIRDEKLQGVIVIVRDITKRILADEAIHESEERFRMIFEEAYDEIVFVSKDGYIIDTNDRIKDIFGYTREEAIGKNFNDIIPFEGDEKRKASETFIKTLLGKPSQFREFKTRQKDGTPIYISISSTLIKKGDHVEGVLNIIRNITEQKQAAEAVRKSENKFRMIFENANDEIVFISKDGTIIDINDRVEDLSGYKREEVIGKNFYDINHLDEKEKRIASEAFIKTLLGEPAHLQEFRAKQKDGTPIYISISSTLVKRGNIVEGVLNIVRNITEQKQAEDAIRESEEKFRMIFENANDAIFYINKRGTVIDANDTAFDLLGHETEKTIGQSLAELEYLETDDLHKMLKVFNAAIAGKTIPMHELELKHKDGTSVFIEANSRAIERNGEIEGLVVIIRDITGRKKTEESLRESEDKFRMIFENAKDEIVFVSNEGLVIDVNDRVEDIFGWKREECIGKSFIEITALRADALQENVKLIDDLIEGKPGSIVEAEAFQKDGERIFIDLSASLIKKEEVLKGIVMIIRDVTERKQMQADLLESHENIHRARAAAIMGLAKLAEYRDEDTGKHLERIREYVKIIAETLKQHPKYRGYITEDYIDNIYNSSILHDVGKVSIPDSILLKPGELTNEEFEIIKTHTTVGGDALMAADIETEERSFLTLGREIAYCHHEQWNGKGYPKGLKGEEIPLSARIVSLADVYDALTSERPYKKAYSHEKSKEVIISGKGTRFDPDIVDIFTAMEKTFKLIRDTMTE